MEERSFVIDAFLTLRIQLDSSNTSGCGFSDYFGGNRGMKLVSLDGMITS